MGKVIGLGGVFIKSPDTAALNAWYKRVLGVDVSDWGGAMFTAVPEGAVNLWTPFKADSDYFAPSTREVMINFVVDDLDGVLALAKSEGVEPLKRDDSDPNGSFAWVMDPDGTKVELWQPKPGGEETSAA